MQKAPVPGKRVVGHQVIEDIRKRMEAGKEHYGTYLMTQNGRSALQDAYEEALDMACYLKQKLMEQEENSRQWWKFWKRA